MNKGPDVIDAGIRLRGDPSRVVARLFVPGQEFAGTEDPKRTGLADRIRDLSGDHVTRALEEIFSDFAHRHDDLSAILHRHGTTMASRGAFGSDLTNAQLMLLGAAFTCEQSIEAAALCNPSMVLAPDQSNLPSGSARFVMSVRCIGEGHRSSLGFRTGIIDGSNHISVADPGRFPMGGVANAGLLSKRAFHLHLGELGQDGAGAASVLDQLGEEFSHEDLETELQRLRAQRDSPLSASIVADRLSAFARMHYVRTFAPTIELSRRVLLPSSPAESHGIEDARLVAFDAGDGSPHYLGTYTAYDGHNVRQQLLVTDDFARFVSMPIFGQAAANKGLAIFPRKIGGRYVALSRHDRESNSLAWSDDCIHWDHSTHLMTPTPLWAAVQEGNCGPPIETDAGWLVLFHGVGLMRTYRIGALLLDLRDPTIVRGYLDDALIETSERDRDGYVPNVVYSCGAMTHNGRLIVPYGIADASIAIATISIDDLLSSLTTKTT